LKQGKKPKKIFKKASTKYSLTKRKSQKSTKWKKGIISRRSEVTEKNRRRKTTSEGYSFVNNLKSEIRKNGSS